jgi:hypothetical protein
MFSCCMRSLSWLVGVVGVGLLVFSCGGEEFGAAGSDDPEAGSGSIDDGEGGAETGTGGSSLTPPQGGRAGSGHAGTQPGGGSDETGGMPGVVGGNGNSGGGGDDPPDDCGDAVPPELPGDCKKVVCSMGNFVDQPDPNDKPEPRGPCDVPQCEGGLPTFGSDPAACNINQVCGEGHCSCSGCPNGNVPALSPDLCRLPAGVTVTASAALADAGPNRVADGNAQTTWNSGTGEATLTITPASPQPMTAVALWLTGSAANNTTPDKKYILVQVNVETDASTSVIKGGNFSFADMSTGPLRLDLGLVKAKKITFTFESPSTWIAVHEVIFEICPQ